MDGIIFPYPSVSLLRIISSSFMLLVALVAPAMHAPAQQLNHSRGANEQARHQRVDGHYRPWNRPPLATPEITSALSASWEGIGYLMKGHQVEGHARFDPKRFSSMNNGRKFSQPGKNNTARTSAAISPRRADAIVVHFLRAEGLLLY
ncbi:hypothetical protein EVAR_99600_1 [Eumeta japonica]|uniref:Uncharacterized protein n=1 Tax=Eumeta variegata TaxID=151549 RepID=A0A4C1ZWF5_EUMVA|nr:hypothetical protein EVAR_99600_1 [Eumeta japonica]